MTPEELHNIYRTEEVFWWYRGMRIITEAMLGPYVAGSFRTGLDAGCGTGFNALDLEQRYGLRMYGVDIARVAVLYCRQRGFRQATVASVIQLPFSDNCFDLVASFDVLSHLPAGDDVPALNELVRVLRPGGLLFLRVPAFPILRSRHSQWIAETHRYRDSELQNKLLALNCTVVRSTYANMLLSPVAFLKFRFWEAIGRAPAQSGVQDIPPVWLNEILFTILKFEAALIRRGFRLAFGQSLIAVAQKSR
jgi:SAM-dependent methyltransferase